MITPAFEFEMLAAGVPKFVVFRKLKISARNSKRLALLNGKRLANATSRRWYEGPRNVLRPAVPWKPADGTA